MKKIKKMQSFFDTRVTVIGLDIELIKHPFKPGSRKYTKISIYYL